MVGYESEAAFSRAFKKAIGTAQATWRQLRSNGRAASVRNCMYASPERIITFLFESGWPSYVHVIQSIVQRPRAICCRV
jgi:methylphosphotriester-DNA--protein-cysteine methyltransferase